MPLRRRGYTSSVLKKRKYNRKTYNRILGAKGLRALTHKPVYFSSTYQVATILAGGAGTVGNYAYNTVLSSIPNYAEYQALFDQYRIKKLVFRFEPVFTDNTDAGGAGAATPANPYVCGYMRIVKDYDDSIALTQESQYLQYDNLISKPVMGKSFKVIVYPKMKLTTGGNTDVSVTPRWIDLDNVNVNHYGIKVYSPVTNLPIGYFETRIYCTVYFECKNRV